jgi:hypothetical protein
MKSVLVLASLLLLVVPEVGSETFTPLEWQRLVLGHPDPRFIGQRKHTGWVRDHNVNFVDDLLDSLRATQDTVDVVIELNDFLPPGRIQAQFDRFGRITYIPKLISGVLMDGVAVARLDSLARFPSVAMIEWQTPNEPMLDVSARGVQARASVTYAPPTFGSAQDENKEGTDAGGNPVNIAILDTGVFDSHDPAGGFTRQPPYEGHIAFGTATDRVCVAGFDATKFEDAANSNFKDDSWETHCGGCSGPGCISCIDPNQDEPGDGKTDPDPVSPTDHGTHVAGVALARGQSGKTCRPPDDASTAACSGVAPRANLIDIKVCTTNLSCTDEDVMEGLDWVGLNAIAQNIKVVNVSIADHAEDDGESLESETVNFVVALGVSVVVAHGNSDAAHPRGSQLTGAPGSASFAITVAGTDDRGTITRTDDMIFSHNLVGPRADYDALTNPDPLALKPDIAAPADLVVTTAFTGNPPPTDLYVSEPYGTSIAAPHVAGAAAILRGAWPNMDPGSLKELLTLSADRSRSGNAPWHPAFGGGILNVYSAIKMKEETPGTDVRFENCVGPAAIPGRPCTLPSGIASWDNYLDITTSPWPPKKDMETTITAQVRNDGSVPAKVTVNFGVFDFGVPGHLLFKHVGSVQDVIPGGTTKPVSTVWKPQSSGHQCVQVGVQYAFDTDYLNNVTQRNLQVSASEYDMKVGNPYGVPTRMHLVATSDRKGWPCKVSPKDFTLDPFNDPPKGVHISFNAPAGAKTGDRASCNVAAYATRIGNRESELVGGVTVQTFVPKPCRLVGQVVDSLGRPVENARVRFWRERSRGTIRPSYERDQTAVTDRGGIFSAGVLSSVEQKLSITHPRVGRGATTLKPECGRDTLRVALKRTEIRILSGL